MDNQKQNTLVSNKLGLGAISIVGASAIAFGGIVAVTAQSPTPTTTPRTGTATPATGTPGASGSAKEQLVADLSSLLTEHVYQSGSIALAIKDDDDQRVQRLQQAAVANTSDLNQAIQALATSAGGGGGSGATRTPTAVLPSPTATVPGANPRGTDFTSLWNLHLAYLVDYANAVKDDRDTQKQQTRQNLDTWSTQFAAVLASRVSGLNEQQVQQALRTHVRELADITDGIDKDDPQVYEQMRESAQHLAQVAGLLGSSAR